MKKITFLIFVLFSMGLQAQLKVIESEPAEEIGVIKDMIEVIKEDYVYTFIYKDAQNQEFKDFKFFSMNEQSFHELYELILKTWDNPPSEDIMIELPIGDILWLDFTKVMGVTNFRFNHRLDKDIDVMGATPWLTKQQLNKLFGKD